MAEVQEQFEQATQQPQPQPQPKKANWWKRGVLIGAGAFVLMVGGCSTLVGLVAIGSESSANALNQPVNSEQSPAQAEDDSLQGPNPPTGVHPTKEVKVIVTALNGPADYSIYDDKWKVDESRQVEEGTHTFTYELPERDGVMVDMMSDKWQNAYVAVKVYEGGKLVAQDEDNNGMASVSY